MQKYIEYAKFMNCQNDVIEWVNVHLAAYLKDNTENQTEIEHIIDYMASDKRPDRISRMSYDQAKSNTEKWNAALIKKGCDIEERPEDVLVEKDFGDGFKVVRLVGSSGYYARIGSSGDSARIGSSGDYAQIEMTGKSSIALAAGLSSKGKLGENGCLVLSRWVEAEKRFRVSVGYEGENLKAGIWYELDENGNFKECE